VRVESAQVVDIGRNDQRMLALGHEHHRGIYYVARAGPAAQGTGRLRKSAIELRYDRGLGVEQPA
jgi:hypothetical protein